MASTMVASTMSPSPSPSLLVVGRRGGSARHAVLRVRAPTVKHGEQRKALVAKAAPMMMAAAADGDDDEPAPIFRIPKEETPEKVNPGYTKLVQETLERKKGEEEGTGGADTVGARLSVVRETMLRSEAQAKRDAASKFQSDAWEGDQYVGSPLNTLTVLGGIAVAAPLAMGLFAALTYGSLWGKPV